jgi:hypothetical protein
MPIFVIERHIHHHYPDSEGSTLTPLLQHMMETLMAQLDDLMTVLGAIHDDVKGVLDRAKNLEAQLNQLQQTTPPQVDLQPAINAATAIREQLEGTAAATGSASGATDAEAQQLREEAETTSDPEPSTSDTGAVIGVAGQVEGEAAATTAPTDEAAGTQSASE